MHAVMMDWYVVMYGTNDVIDGGMINQSYPLFLEMNVYRGAEWNLY